MSLRTSPDRTEDCGNDCPVCERMPQYAASGVLAAAIERADAQAAGLGTSARLAGATLAYDASRLAHRLPERLHDACHDHMRDAVVHAMASLAGACDARCAPEPDGGLTAWSVALQKALLEAACLEDGSLRAYDVPVMAALVFCRLCRELTEHAYAHRAMHAFCSVFDYAPEGASVVAA